ncbi:MAG: hypothetical protein DRR19_15960 [Candidatus Parabeggiatoa sp. nov. 1]|nr:MAG: hypothetical protein DRR19_15960 [Gammaproteobacteria bacterium]
MLNRLVGILFVVLISYSSNADADTCSYAFDPELGWLSEVAIASGEAEPISEVPAPVTVITSQMIKDIGARNLKDVLSTYVPGITFVQDHNEVNVAVRGVYSSTQNKILIMLNGHRLNSRSLLQAGLDYSISLDKIECIEVLRAPSPLYGNVALAAVINIITKKGTDMGGIEVSIGLGNHGQRKFSFVHGNEFENGKSDLLLWGTYYQSDGETVGVQEDYPREPTDSHAILDGFDDPPSYDIGINYELGDFTLLATQRYSKYIEPFSAAGPTGESYNYQDYRRIRGIGPGLGSKFSHFGIDYDKAFDNGLNVQLQMYYDENEIQVHAISNPTIKEHIFAGWYERDLGFIAQLSGAYNFGSDKDSTWMIGSQVDTMEVYDSDYILGNRGEWTDFKDKRGKKLLDTGKEKIYSVFTQVKQRISDNWLVNLGMRYDKKERHKKEVNLNEISPRAALIWIPDDEFDVKLSYSRAFVDAPYWYRYNILPSYRGGVDLEPESMESFQFTPTIKWAEGKINSRFNLFYNKFSGFIWRNNRAEGEDIYQNAGELKVLGIENETSYRANTYNIAFNVTYQAADSSEKFPDVLSHEIWNIPNWTANAVFNFNPLELFDAKLDSVSNDLWLNLTARYVGEQLSPIYIVFNKGEDNEREINKPDHEVDDVLLFNTGFRWNNLWNGLFLDGRVYNLLDEKYEQGGTVLHPYPQPGRWWMITVGYQFGL